MTMFEDMSLGDTAPNFYGADVWGQGYDKDDTRKLVGHITHAVEASAKFGGGVGPKYVTPHLSRPKPPLHDIHVGMCYEAPSNFILCRLWLSRGSLLPSSQQRPAWTPSLVGPPGYCSLAAAIVWQRRLGWPSGSLAAHCSGSGPAVGRYIYPQRCARGQPRLFAAASAAAGTWARPARNAGGGSAADGGRRGQ